MIVPSRRIVLTGFMGAGKSTIAESLADRFNCSMIDLDALIAGREGRSISSIINDDGEARFREIESDALIDALEYKAARIIALGGGTWTFEHNRVHVDQHECFTVWLDAPFELCWQRISNEASLRPLAHSKTDARKLYDVRKNSYSLAMLRVEVVKETSVDDLTARIIEELPD